ncbi:NADPH-dependent FMN reductase [Tatumella citrea]|uniref:FMN reductase n=1 Tax=Tatumella citrea TaxID=53336 RepID=A0A1Y0LBZ0_TATCI|nr:NADPH-dependent FMN reductase [Tatumella citrea]ARU95586.1 FMN reductase [Tatumella citrea]ARU99627.1 FMN reductase [Tatumella citrea]
MFKVIGISGSLRNSSLNSLFLRAMALIAPKDISFEISALPGNLPLFNPDLEDAAPEIVSQWRHELQQADLFLIVSPEYAHGVSGVIKNALDWLVSSGELLDKPVAMPNLSPRTDLAQGHLREIVTVMGGMLSDSCSPAATLDCRYVLPDITEQQLIDHPRISPRLQQLWQDISDTLHSS